MFTIDKNTFNEEETIHLGREFATQLRPTDIVAIYGDLGSGKTEFVKGICDFFKVEEIVTSPTFTIVNKYNGIKDQETFAIYHIDLYRIEKDSELLEIGFEEYLSDSTAISLIEWAEKTTLLPEKIFSINIFLDDANDNQRLISIKSHREINIRM